MPDLALAAAPPVAEITERALADLAEQTEPTPSISRTGKRNFLLLPVCSSAHYNDDLIYHDGRLSSQKTALLKRPLTGPSILTCLLHSSLHCPHFACGTRANEVSEFKALLERRHAHERR